MKILSLRSYFKTATLERWQFGGSFKTATSQGWQFWENFIDILNAKTTIFKQKILVFGTATFLTWIITATPIYPTFIERF